MLILLLAAVLTDAQQAKHDDMERDLYSRLQADQNAIYDIWRPEPKLLSDYRAARHCYTNFHLYKADDCKAEFDAVDRDLAKGKPQ